MVDFEFVTVTDVLGTSGALGFPGQLIHPIQLVGNSSWARTVENNASNLALSLPG